MHDKQRVSLTFRLASLLQSIVSLSLLQCHTSISPFPWCFFGHTLISPIGLVAVQSFHDTPAVVSSISPPFSRAGERPQQWVSGIEISNSLKVFSIVSILLHQMLPSGHSFLRLAVVTVTCLTNNSGHNTRLKPA